MILAMLAALAMILMHQIGGATPAHASSTNASMHMAHHEMPVSMESAVAGDSAHHNDGQHDGGAEHPATCGVSHDPCQGVATPDFALPVSLSPSTLPTARLMELKTNDFGARLEREPPGRANLSVWRI